MSTGRPYKSSLRQEQAQQTRLRIRRAARELFEKQGFLATTVPEIARHAGVAPATVYAAFDSKAGIVSAMLEDLEESIDVGSRIRDVFEESDPREQLRLYISAHCALFTHGADVLRTAVRAIDNPEVAALDEDGNRHRWEAIETLTTRWNEAGALRTGLNPREAAERLWLLTTVEGFLHAVDGLGWTPAEYEAWLGDLAEREVLVPEGEQKIPGAPYG